MILEGSFTPKSSGFFGLYHVLFYDSCHLGLTVGARRFVKGSGLNLKCLQGFEEFTFYALWKTISRFSFYGNPA